MDGYELVISEILSGTDETKERIEKLKKKISPVSSRSELKETLDSIIKEDPDYVRRFLKNSSTIVFQKDFYIDDVNRLLYKGVYNNDSEYYSLINKCILISFVDYALYSENYSYFTDIYVNGVRVDESRYIIRDSNYAHSRFFTGAKRLFLRKTEVKSGDTVSIVVKKFRNYVNFYKPIKITSTIISDNQTQFPIHINEIGDFLERFENLIVYKKAIGTGYFLPLDTKSYNLHKDGDILYFNILETPIIGDCYLVINKTRLVKYSFENTCEVSREEYIEHFAVLNIDFVDKNIKVDGAYLPIPVNGLEECEVFVNGYRLINGYDFVLINNNPAKPQHIHLAGILEPNAKVILRSKNLSDEFAFYYQFIEMATKGYLNLEESKVPVSEDYVEAFVCRRRVPLVCKRNILNRYLKIDSQKSLQYIETFPEIEITQLAYEVLTEFRNEINKVPQNQILNSFTGEVINEWEKHNPIKENEGLIVPNEGDNSIFIGHIDSIRINVDSSVVQEGKIPEISVIGFYSEGSTENQIGVDLTAYCEISTFDPFEIGKHTIYAKYKQNDQILEDQLTIETVLKELVGIRIYTNSNFYVIGDAIKSTVNVIAKFADNSEKNITDICEIDCPEIAEMPGFNKINVSFNYNGRTVTTYKDILVSETSERKIMNLDIVLDNYVTENKDQISNISLYATYTNNMIQKIDKANATVYVVTNDEEGNPVSLTEIPDIENYKFESFEKPADLKIEIFTNQTKKEKVNFIEPDGTLKTFTSKSIRVIYDVFEENNRYLIHNDYICNLDPTYLANIPAEYKSYRIKNISNDIITYGSANVNDEIILAVIPTENIVIVDFLNENLEIVGQSLFKLVNKNEIRPVIDCEIKGNPIDGYCLTISKFEFGRSLTDLNLDGIQILDQDYAQVTSFNQSIDIASEDENFIYFYFKDFCSTGNVNVLTDIMDSVLDPDSEKKLYMDIINVDKLINLIPNLTHDILVDELDILEDCYIDRSTSNYQLVIMNKFTNDTCKLSYASYPNEHTLENRYPLTTTIRLPLQYNTENYIFITDNKLGNTIYYFLNEANTIIYKLTLNINKINNRIRILSVNNTPLTEDEYNRIPIKYMVTTNEKKE